MADILLKSNLWNSWELEKNLTKFSQSPKSIKMTWVVAQLTIMERLKCLC